MTLTIVSMAENSGKIEFTFIQVFEVCGILFVTLTTNMARRSKFLRNPQLVGVRAF